MSLNDQHTGTLAMPAIAALRQRLSWLRRQIRWLFFIDGVNWTLLVGSIVAILWCGIWALVEPPITVLAGLASIGALVVFLVLVRRLVYPLSRRISDTDLVVLLEREFPHLNDRLISALQLLTYQGRANHSAMMIAKLAEEANELAQGLNVREVLRPNTLMPIGIAAVGASLALAGTSLALSVQENRLRLGVELVFPTLSESGEPDQHIPRETEINFARQEAPLDALDSYAGQLVVAEKSDLVIRAIPRSFRGNEADFDIGRYREAEVVILRNGEREYLRMRAEGGKQGFYQFIDKDIQRVNRPKDLVERDVNELLHRLDTNKDGKIQLSEWKDSAAEFAQADRDRNGILERDDLRAKFEPSFYDLWVRWHGAETEKYRVFVKPAPQIDTLNITYRAPVHMRKRDVTLDSGRADSPAIKVTPTDQGGYTVWAPKLDDKGKPVMQGDAIQYQEYAFKTDKEFAAVFPGAFRAHMRERVENQDTVNATEGTLATFTFETNHPIDPARSFLGVRYRPTTADVPSRTPRFELTPLDSANRKWEASIKLTRDMMRYYIVLTDLDGLKQSKLVESQIIVRPDKPPLAKFVTTGVPLKEGSTERLSTPEGYLPVQIEAEDDFGLRGLRLLYRIGESEKGEFTEVPRFADEATTPPNPANPTERPITVATLLRGTPERIAAVYTIRMGPLTRNLTVSHDAPVTIQFQLVAEDIKYQPDVGHGQTFSTIPFSVQVMTKQRMRAEIRFLLRKVVKRQVLELLEKQSALVSATRKLLRDPAAVDLGLLIRDVFPREERDKDNKGNPRRIDGAQLQRLQDEITRTCQSLTSRVDAIVRHYIYNDLEEEDRTKMRQETTLQLVKILTALLSVPKQDALLMNDLLKSINETTDNSWLETQASELLKLLFNPTSPWHGVRRSFSLGGFTTLLKKIELKHAGASREAALTMEQAVAAANDTVTRRSNLERVLALQVQCENALFEVVELVRQWEGFEEHREELRKQQERILKLREELERLARGQ